MEKDIKLCLDGLLEIIYEKKKSTDIINELSSKTENIAYVTKIIYGVLENKIYIDYMIGKLSKVKISKIQKPILVILEMGIYNLHFLDKKDYAVVNELVELSKTINNRSSSFVNAILRSFIRDSKEITKIYERDDLKALSIRYSTPLELVKYINDSYDYEYLKKFLKSINEESPISIRINFTKTGKEKLKNNLEKKGFVTEESNISNRALKILNSQGLAQSEEFKNGLFTIQSEASMKVVEILDPKEGSNILDICAAPGTKTSYISEYTNNNSKIVANDINSDKNHYIKENIDRLGLKNIIIENFDASLLNETYINKFDYVLVDAPCSGLGVMGRKPEIRYNRSTEDIKSLSKLQREILDKSVNYLKKDGILVYSTCSLGKLENFDNFSYLAEKKELKIERIDGRDFKEFSNFRDKTDGFFISKFKKII